MAVTTVYRRNDTDIVVHRFAWTSAADGTATVVSPNAISGTIRRVVFVPSATAAPTDLYDLTLTDSDSVDVLAGRGANLLTATTGTVCPGVPLKDGTTTSVTEMTVDSVLTLNVTNAGDTKSGTVILYLR